MKAVARDPLAAAWPPGVPRTMPVPRLTLAQALAATAARVPGKAAIHYGGATTTYAQLRRRAEALAAFLRHRLGVAPGDRVLVVGQNSPQWVTAAYAVLRAGGVIVPVSPMSKATEVAFHAEDSGARVALGAQECLEALPLAQAPHAKIEESRPGANGAIRDTHRGEAPPALRGAIVWAYSDAIASQAAEMRGDTAEALPDWMRAPRRPLHDPRLHGFEDAIADATAGGLDPGPMPADPDALAVLAYTSGTTGRPKGCMHTHATLLASLVTSAAWKPVHGDSVVLTVAPLFHMLGLQNGMNLPLLVGATAVMMPRWHAPTAAALIERHRVTVWSAPPAMVIDLFAQQQAQPLPEQPRQPQSPLAPRAGEGPGEHGFVRAQPGPSLARGAAPTGRDTSSSGPAHTSDVEPTAPTTPRDLSSLVTLTGGGAAMPEAVAAMLLERYGLAYQEGYGLTETASFLHANPPARGKRQCLGVPTPNVDSRIVDPATLAELQQGEVGELVTHAPQLMLGYWQRPDADREAFIEIEGRRYLRTGDLALVDDEGYFFMKDRLKRMINSSGYKVWPAEVENALYAHPAVHEACVIGVPDTRRGEAVKAVVVLKPGWAGRLAADEFIAWCRERMSVVKAPRLVDFVEALPKSATGKIAWRELQEAQARAAATSPD